LRAHISQDRAGTSNRTLQLVFERVLKRPKPLVRASLHFQLRR
jgi:hypothetical protein